MNFREVVKPFLDFSDLRSLLAGTMGFAVTIHVFFSDNRGTWFGQKLKIGALGAMSNFYLIWPHMSHVQQKQFS